MAQLPKHGGNVSPMIRAMVDDMLHDIAVASLGHSVLRMRIILVRIQIGYIPVKVLVSFGYLPKKGPQVLC